MTDSTPNLDAGATRGIINAAEFHVTSAHAAIVSRVAAGAVFTEPQRDAARELGELYQEANELRGQERTSSDDELVARAGEIKVRADRIVERASELQALFDDGPAMPALDVALDALQDAVLSVAEELTVDAPLDPDDLLWTTDRLALVLEETEGVFTELGDRAASWRDLVLADRDLPAIFGATPAAERAYLAQLRDAPDRLYAAAHAVRLAARRGHLVELASFRRPAEARVRVAGAWIDVLLLDEARRTYRVRVAGSPGTDPTAAATTDSELVAAIAGAAGVDLADTEGRVGVRQAADRVRRELTAIVAYRNTARRGDPNDAARLAEIRDPADIDLPYSHRPDSTQDLVDVLLDLHAERWPVASVLRDTLAAVCRVLDDDAQAGVDRLLSHRNEDETAGAHVRALVEAYTAAALEHEARRLRDPQVLRYTLMSTVRALREQGRPATVANLHAIATKQLVSRDDVGAALVELETEGLLEREDPLAARTVVWQLTAAGDELVDAP